MKQSLTDDVDDSLTRTVNARLTEKATKSTLRSFKCLQTTCVLSPAASDTSRLFPPSLKRSTTGGDRFLVSREDEVKVRKCQAVWIQRDVSAQVKGES